MTQIRVTFGTKCALYSPPYTAKLRLRLDVSISPPMSTMPSSTFSSSSDGGKKFIPIMSLKKPNRAKSYLLPHV